jgi:hypothetical protein
MIIQFKSTSGEVVNTNFVTPQLMATVGPFSKLITYPTYAKSGDYSYSGPYFGDGPPNNNPGAPTDTDLFGNTEPVEGQLTADYLDGEELVKVGPTGSYLFPLGQGGSWIGFYSPTGVLYTKFKMEDAAAAATGITTIATALGAGDAYLLLDVDGSNITPP